MTIVSEWEVYNYTWLNVMGFKHSIGLPNDVVEKIIHLKTCNNTASLKLFVIVIEALCLTNYIYWTLPIMYSFMTEEFGKV